MSRLIISVILCLLLISLAGAVQAAGFVPLGKEKCKSNSLEAAGVVPDNLNRFKESLVFLKWGSVLDRIAGEIKSVLSQFGIQTTHHWLADKVKSKSQSTRSYKRKRRIRVPSK